MKLKIGKLDLIKKNFKCSLKETVLKVAWNYRMGHNTHIWQSARVQIYKEVLSLNILNRVLNSIVFKTNKRGQQDGSAGKGLKA